MADPIAASPLRTPGPKAVLDGWEVSVTTAETDLSIADMSPLAKVLVRSDSAPFDVPYGTARPDDHTNLIVGSAPGEWLVLGPPATAEVIAEGIPRPGFTIVVDLTHGRAVMRVTGAAAPPMLSKVCAIDLSDPMAPNGAAFRAPVGGVVTDIIRLDRGGIRSYLLHCERSSGQYLFDVLIDAGTEYRIGIVGFGSLLDRPDPDKGL